MTPPELDQFTDNIRKKITSGKFEPAFDQLNDYLQSGSSKLKNELVLHESEYNDLFEDFRQGKITRDKFQADKAVLIARVLQFLDALAKEINEAEPQDMEHPLIRIIWYDENTKMRIEIPGNGGIDVGKIFLDSIRQRLVKMFTIWFLQYDKINKDDEVSILGEILYEATHFHIKEDDYQEDAQKKEVIKRIKEIIRDKEPIRFELNFEDCDTEYGNYPWEIICRPKGGKRPWLCDKHIFYRLIGKHVPEVSPENDKIRILFVSFLTEDEKKEIMDTEGQSTRKKISIDDFLKEIDNTEIRKIIDKISLDDLATEIEDFCPHIIHFIGSGFVEYEGPENFTNYYNVHTEPKTIRDFRTVLEQLKKTPPRLLFYHFCQRDPKKPIKPINLHRLAAALKDANIYNFVTLFHPIRLSTAKTFTDGFYENLAKGKSVEMAVYESRKMITDVTSWEAASPILYMQRKEDKIFRQKPPKKDLDLLQQSN